MLVNVAAAIVIVFAGYLFGSIPSGYLVGRARGVDLRRTGSGNIGATNAFRVLGKTAGAIVLVADALKGFLACVVVPALVLSRFAGMEGSQIVWYRAMGGAAAVLGHTFSCWLRFKGGKGVATGAGVFAGLAPVPLAIALGTWLVLFVVTRYVSVASMGAAVALAGGVWLVPLHAVVRWTATVLAVLVLWRHRSNIRRLIEGTELRIGNKSSASEPSNSAQ